ncbi:MAG: ribokinase [Eubacteriales bacterium]|nr:ribokinase [Eubacteriales bacterium]
MKVLNFGSLNVDYVYQMRSILQPGETQASYSRNVYCGGKGLNQSIALAKAGVPVYHAGLIGEGGEILLDACKESGVNAEYIKKIDGPCGHTIIQVDQNGQNCILLYGGANRMLTEEYIDEVLSHFEKGDILLLQNEVNLLHRIIEKAFEKGMKIILNPSPFDDALEKCDLTKINLFLVNEIEGSQITGGETKPEVILTKIKELYPDASIVLTLGGDGSVYQDKTGIYHQGIYKVKAVDTTAAGDTFTGYFIASILENMPVQEGLKLAAKASAIAVSRPGATASIPLREEVEKGETYFGKKDCTETEGTI